MENDSRILTKQQIEKYCVFLQQEEKSRVTIEKYRRDLLTFERYAGGRPVSKELTMAYKKLLCQNYRISSANSMLAAVNGFLNYQGWAECRVRQFKVQRQIYGQKDRELTKSEYFRLTEEARKQNKNRLNVILQTICSTGIRVSELRFFTVETVKKGKVTVSCKNKVRIVLIPKQLRTLLLRYAKNAGIPGGKIFVTKNGKEINRSNLWAEMKKLCEGAGVLPEKVFPHNLRKLFARIFYSMEKDIAKLADLLGHSSVNTTRIYIVSTGTEHRELMERLGLIDEKSNMPLLAAE